MTHLPYSTDFPKPGDTLTAAQANSLPVGSEVSLVGKGKHYVVSRKKEGYWCDYYGGQKDISSRINAGFICTLIRVGPAALAVGDVVTREQLDALPMGVILRGPDGALVEKHNEGWSTPLGTTMYPSLPHEKYTVAGIPAASPTNPHAEGSLDWARWVAEKEGVCVQRQDPPGQHPWRFRDGQWEHWYTRMWFALNSDVNGWSIETSSTGWSIVPDPSAAAETPVETSDDRFAALTAQMVELKADYDAAITHRNASTQIAKRAQATINELTTDLDRLRTENADLLAELNTFRYARTKNMETIEAERDAALQRTEKAEMECGIVEEAVEQRAAAIAGLEAERDELLGRCAREEQRAAKAEATEREWVARGSQIDADMYDLREEVQEWKRAAEKAEALLVHRHTAWQAAAKVVVPKDVREAARWLIKRHKSGYVHRVCQHILSLTDHSVDANKMVHVGVDMATGPDRTVFQSTHPEGSREWAEDAMRQGLSVISTCCNPSQSHWTDFVCSRDGADPWQLNRMCETGWRIHQPAVAPSPLPSVAQHILSLTDHSVDANKMVQSTHPEGSRAWAEDAISQGYQVANEASKAGACPTWGWRIHQPAVAPSPLPSVAQLQASIEALNERIVALENRK